jgi:hypothetical protein
MMLNQWVAEQMVAGASAEHRCRAHARQARPRLAARRWEADPAPWSRLPSGLSRRAGELLIAVGNRLAPTGRPTPGAAGSGPLTSRAGGAHTSTGWEATGRAATDLAITGPQATIRTAGDLVSSHKGR